MPVLVLAAKLCPEGMEATLFATLMSISNGGSVLGGLIGAGLTQLFGITKDSFDNLAFLIILCNLTSLLPLPLLGLLPPDTSDTIKEKDGGDIEMKANWIWDSQHLKHTLHLSIIASAPPKMVHVLAWLRLMNITRRGRERNITSWIEKYRCIS